MNIFERIPDAAKNWMIVTVLSAFLAWFIGACKKHKALKEGMKVLLQSDIRRDCKEYRQRQSISEEELDDLNDKYNVYKLLGGNGAVKKIYDEVYALPTSDKE